MRIALVGKIDINRDGRDDRADLKRMIEGAGGKSSSTSRRPTSAASRAT